MRRFALCAAALLAGCSLQPRYDRPEPPVPPSWPVGDAYLRQSEATLPAIGYRDIFRDARLQQIVTLALANNRDLRVAAANIAAARAQYRIQRSDLLPQIDASGRATFGEGSSSLTTTTNNGGTGIGTGTTTGDGAVTGTGNTGTGNTGTGNSGTGNTGTGNTGTGNTGTGNTGTITTGGFRDSYSASVGLSAFEIDLFGRVRSLSDAALDRYFATEAAARTVRVSLVADIANAWVSYAADASLLKIAQDTAKSAGNSVRLTRARLEGGISPRTELRQAELVQAQAESDLAQQTSAIAQDINALTLLVGAPVDATLLAKSIEEAGPSLAELPAGLDSGVLLRRPDVVQAEYQLRATNAQIGAARAALFPRISLTALLGFASGSLTSLFDGGNFSYSVAPNVSYPIFSAGAGINGVRYSEAQKDAALATYEKAIQTAFREVADQLARRGTIDAQERAQDRLVAASLDNYRLSDARYRGGIDTFLQNLDAQRSLYTAQRSQVATRLARAQNLVALYRTLGGDAQLEATSGGPVEAKPRIQP